VPARNEAQARPQASNVKDRPASFCSFGFEVYLGFELWILSFRWLGVVLCLALPVQLLGAFGVTSSGGYYTGSSAYSF
jgi:hypothetical protein